MKKSHALERKIGYRNGNRSAVEPVARSLVSTAAGGVDGSDGGDRAISFICPDGERYVFVCDVLGHGESAGSPANFLAEAVRMLVCQGMSPALVIATLNVGLRHYYGHSGTFASAFLAVPRGKSITYVSAGHPDALLFFNVRRHAHVSATGPLLGLFDHPEYQERTVFAPSGTTLVVATDGVTDASRVDGGRVEESGFARAVASSLLHPQSDLATTIVNSVRDHARFTDDYAVLTLRL